MVGKPITTKQKIDIANLYMQGMTYNEIARELNISKNSVYRMVKNDYETKELLKEMQRDYKNEILDLCINEMKEILLDESVSQGLKTTIIATGLKYSGAITDKVEVTKKEEPLNLEELYAKFNI